MKFIEGQYYYTEWKDGYYIYIFKATSSLENCDNLCISQKHFYENSGDFTGPTIINNRLATREEIVWFELCKKEGKYVEKPIFEEEIY